MTGAEVILQVLKDNGVDTVFGLPGGANLPLYDALFDGGIRHVLCRHEQGVGHAAEGYAKATGRVGVALATSGPGATNLVTAIADAQLDSVPVVFITGQVKTELIGTDSFQEADIYGITLPVVKHSYTLRDAAEIAPSLSQAFEIAASGRPGPVLVDVPQDLMRQEITDIISSSPLPGYNPTKEGNLRQIKRACQAIALSERPVLYVGGGAMNASEEIRRLVDLTDIPLTATLMGLGIYPADGPAWLGMLGMHGTRAANYSVDEADLLICLSARFDDRVTGKLDQFSPVAKKIHVDVDPAEISKNVSAHIPVVGDAKLVVGEMVAEIERTGFDKSRPDLWREKIRSWQASHPLPDGSRNDGQIAPHSIIDALVGICPEAVISSDVGQHQMWCAQRFPFTRPRQWINSGGLGTMGFGLPAAIGAKIALPNQLVVCLSGDGSLAMSATEIATAVEAGAAVKICLLNNGGYGMVRQWQELFWDERYSQVQLGQSTDWVALAQSLGAEARRVSDPNQLLDAVSWLVNSDGVALLDVITGDDHVYPMIPAGAAARDMVG